MAEPFLSLDAHERAGILRTAAARHRRSPVILEKDIWVCWVLHALFSMPDAHPMAFKGGTSLSKVYSVIDRFSEDVDVTLDYRAFGDGFDPFADGASCTRIRQFGERLKALVASHVRAAVAPALDAAARRLGADGGYDIHVGDDGETLRFAYPSAVERRDAYIRNEVLLEFGGRNVIDRNERHAIVPDIAAMTDGLDWPAATVTVLSPARTFWEKTTLVHVEWATPCARRPRHASDRHPCHAAPSPPEDHHEPLRPPLPGRHRRVALGSRRHGCGRRHVLGHHRRSRERRIRHRRRVRHPTGWRTKWPRTGYVRDVWDR